MFGARVRLRLHLFCFQNAGMLSKKSVTWCGIMSAVKGATIKDRSVSSGSQSCCRTLMWGTQIQFEEIQNTSAFLNPRIQVNSHTSLFIVKGRSHFCLRFHSEIWGYSGLHLFVSPFSPLPSLWVIIYWNESKAQYCPKRQGKRSTFYIKFFSVCVLRSPILPLSPPFSLSLSAFPP